jgi:ATP-dependent DNA helicase RecQ
MDTAYFEMLTVPTEQLESVSDAHSARRPTVGSQWRLSYSRPAPPDLSPEAVRALSVADKLINKGQVTLLPQALEQALDRASTPASTLPAIPDPELDSDEERLVWSRLLPAAMGPAFAVWCTPQVEISTLTLGADFAGSEQRVDFLIAHPSLERPLIVEIDGDQHAAQGDYDTTRTRHLEANGYGVVRIPAAEIRTGSGEGIDQLAGLLSGLEPIQHYAGVLASPIRRAGQIQVALLHALFTGMAPLVGGFSVSTDLVGVGELTQTEFELVISDFADLLQRVSRLYGADGPGVGVAASAGTDTADLHLGFFGTIAPSPTMLVEDVYLPVSIKWTSRPVQAGCPTEIDRDLIRYFLTRVFRKPDYRDGQYDIIARALQGKDTVALLPTGAGKSIAFQLAGMLLPGRTIVIAPIISLIRDQVYNLRSYGIDRALGISSDLSGRAERDLAYELLKHGEAFFYYIAPERFQMAEFREKLRGMTAAFPVNLIVVDEAHCVSEWGHDFRTAYLRIGRTSRECSTSGGWTPALVALTGTASRAVLRDLQRELQITDFDAIVTPTTFDREELQYAVLNEKSEHKRFVLESYLRNTLPSAFGLPPESFFRRDGRGTYCGLIFCPNVNGSYGVVDVAGSLAGAGIDAAYYAGTRPKSFYGSDSDWKAYKRQTERRFKRDELSVLVATKAFGMGVDKPNIRFTVHYGIPASIEAFYQEAGRAGRDGQKAICTAIVSDDRSEKNRQLLAPATSIEEVARFVHDTPYDQNDDVTRTLFFHVQGFKGVPAEIAAVDEIHSALSPTGERAARLIPFGVDSKMTEKALHRLVVVGVIGDYTVDYSSRSFSVTLANATRKSVVEKYCAYVAGYQRGRAEQERKKADALVEDWDGFVVGVVGLYVQFVYDVIERGQRRAIAEMLAACQSGSGEELRRRILDYLEHTEFSEAVEAMLSDARSGLGIIADVLAEIISPNDAARLRGSVARSLETYPDHPGLLLLRAATEALSRDGDDQTILENFEAFLVNSVDAYGLGETEIAGGTGVVLRIVGRKNMGAALLIEQAFVRRIRGREALRLLVAESGVAAAQVSPWLLLEDTSSGTDRYTP